MFSTEIPDISPEDIALIKKTAFYSSQYPWFKPRHKFARKGHSLYPYYTALIGQYKKLLNDPPQPTHPSQVLTRAYELAQEEQERQETEAAAKEESEKERLAFAQIDWQDFTILQTINFTAKDLKAELPEALSRDAIAQTPLAERGNIIANLGKKDIYIVSPFTGEKIKSSEYDDHVKVMNSAGNQQQQEKVEKTDKSNLYYDDVEENLRNWKKSKLK